MSSIVCGVDEAGRGPVIGPMVIAVACIEEENVGKLSEIGVKDSKELSRAQRQILYEKLRRILIFHDYVIVSPEEIDKYVRENKLNILELEKIKELVKKVLERFPDKRIIIYVDSPDVKAERFEKMLKNSLSSDRVEIYARHRADATIPIVSAASIIAKYVRDREIEKLKLRYGDFGSGYPSDPRTIRFLISYISRHGEPPPIARKTWRTCKNIIRELKKGKLFE
ncbi:MAG: ribonuclease HII [Crenarchaeota archaeon]|nr:ribonuclease HII [Thermoproteota archaeon]